MNLLVCGAKLQGIEAIYLAKKAGYRVTVVDRDPAAPGADLADRFIAADVRDKALMIPLVRQADVVLPAIEDEDVLRCVDKYGKETQTPVILDLGAYAISRSKQRSNQLFEKLRIPMPANYPDCGYPAILKPDGRSGSQGVRILRSETELNTYFYENSEFLAGQDDSIVIQEYLEGPSYSLEVLGDGAGHFCCPLITEVITDDSYDCKRILAPAQVTAKEEAQMYAIARKLAQALNIRGIFDIEVISHKGQLKILEIDARLPSQTPISVYHSTGINMVVLLAEALTGKNPLPRSLPAPFACCLYQQVDVTDEKLRVLGEHIMAQTSHLRLIRDFFGADEAITDYLPGRTSWRAIVIITRPSEQEAWAAFEAFAEQVQASAGWRQIAGADGYSIPYSPQIHGQIGG